VNIKLHWIFRSWLNSLDKKTKFEAFCYPSEYVNFLWPKLSSVFLKFLKSYKIKCSSKFFHPILSISPVFSHSNLRLLSFLMFSESLRHHHRRSRHHHHGQGGSPHGRHAAAYVPRPTTPPTAMPTLPSSCPRAAPSRVRRSQQQGSSSEIQPFHISILYQGFQYASHMGKCF